ncbi:ABC transporter substrate-binding protein [Clostridium chromiireducens]|uniref:SsuA/THI5-like domain-containing protein n=1 Tax=Clostridium chromiireducens TaxID=225345 RepID=A0A1V4IDQ0_9CLOT|nr:ABC transporter substrate-binding protein [Clostridium chromiireducens]OPJ57657.1 hypothetical protein CLCHR_43130 [Clostridium chromiireducens]
MKNKLKVLTALLISGVTAISMFGCNSNSSSSSSKTEETNKVTTVRLNEVTRSVFYAPMYVAMKQGFFKENGIEIDLQTGHAP